MKDINMIAKFSSALALCLALFTVPLLAEIQKVSVPGSDGLYTRTTVTDWDEVRDSLLAAYGGEVKEITLAGLQDPALSGANIATLPKGQIFILAGEDSPPALMAVMAEVFPDFAKEDLSEYVNGLAVSMQRDGASYQVDGTVYKTSRTPKAAAGGSVKIRVGDDREINFPEGSKLLLQDEQNQGPFQIETLSLTVPQTFEATKSHLSGQLDGAGVAYQETDMGGTARFGFGAKGAPPSSITVAPTGSDPNETVISIMLFTANK